MKPTPAKEDSVDHSDPTHLVRELDDVPAEHEATDDAIQAVVRKRRPDASHGLHATKVHGAARTVSFVSAQQL